MVVWRVGLPRDGDSWEGEEGEWNDVQRKQLTFRVRSCLVCTQKKN